MPDLQMIHSTRLEVHDEHAGCVRPPSIFEVFDWAALPEGSRVVDVGDATGVQSILLAVQRPTLRYFIQDQEKAIRVARQNWAGQMHDFVTSSQVVLQEHNPSGIQPVRNVSVFIFHYTIDLLGDDEAVHVMVRLREAAAPGARMIVYFNRGRFPCEECIEKASAAKLEGQQKDTDSETRIAITPSDVEQDKSRRRDLEEVRALIRRAGWRIILRPQPSAPANQTVIAGA